MPRKIGLFESLKSFPYVHLHSWTMRNNIIKNLHTLHLEMEDTRSFTSLKINEAVFIKLHVETATRPSMFLLGKSNKSNINENTYYSKTPIYRASWGKGIKPGKSRSTVNRGAFYIDLHI